MKVRHAELLQVYGKVVRFLGFSFMPAMVNLAGTSFSPSFPLSDIPFGQCPPILRAPVETHYDVAWVRGRLPDAFGVTPEPSEVEKTVLMIGFVAVPDGADEAVAFECSDYYGRTSLTFSDNETDEALKKQVADTFWAYLLAEPDALEDFEANVPHDGASIMMLFGCRNGEPFYEEKSW